jgi:disulfide bond formation protein DsbB
MVPRQRLAMLFTALVGAAVLGIAIASERWGGLVPCALCLVERWPWRAAIAIGLIGAVLPRDLGRLTMALLVLVMLAGAGAGGTHVGVEAGWWPSPLPECAAPSFGGGSIAERLARMPDKPSKPCDAPTFLIPGLPVSMAMMNLLASLGVAAGLAWFWWTSRRSDP